MPGTPTVHTQGVRPMSGARVGPLPDAVEPLAFGLRALPTPGSDEERLLREYYRGELGGTRVVLDLVRPRRQAFFARIEAGPAASRP